MKMRWQPSLQIIPHYESEPMYISALTNSINKKLTEINWKPDLIISSYHGIPKSYFNKGDPYHCYCQKTTRLIKEQFDEIEIQRGTNYNAVRIFLLNSCSIAQNIVD